MTELEQARQEKTALYRRWKEARAAFLDAVDAAERHRQRERERILGEMYREACATVQRLDPEQIPNKDLIGKKGKAPARMETVLNCGAVWADLEGVCWGGVQRYAHETTAVNGRQARAVQEMVSTAAAKCTPLQGKYLHAYYTERLTLEEIGERFGVDVSTVSRTLKRARGRIEQYITARLLISRCVDETGRFDYIQFLNSAPILTDRQRETAYLILARDTSYRDIARYIDRTPCTVTGTARRVEDKLEGIAVRLERDWSAVRVERADWAERSEKQLAEDLGLSPAFYYRVVLRGATADGVPLLHCAILHRLAAGESVACAAKTLGCSGALVKRVRRTYEGRPLPEFTEDYRPKPPRRVRPPKNPFAALSGDAVIDRIDAETYEKLRRRFGGEDHAGA